MATVEAATVYLDGIQHEATVQAEDRGRTFTFRSDEPPQLVGKDEHPYPLHCSAAAIGL